MRQFGSEEATKPIRESAEAILEAGTSGPSCAQRSAVGGAAVGTTALAWH